MTSEASGERPFVVVGVDGSASSIAALGWAARYVEAVGGTLEAVAAWHYPADYGYAVAIIDLDLSGAATEGLEATLAELRKDHPNLTVTPRIEQGPAAMVLVDRAAAADLLVVGSRGHGGFTDLLLGSVSTHCVHHARCVVVVVREPEAPEP